MKQVHNPLQGAAWMLTAGLCFAMVNSLSQYVSFKLGLPSTTVAFIQYAIALVAMLPWLKQLGIRQSLKNPAPWATLFAGVYFCHRDPTLALGARLPSSHLARHCASDDIAAVRNRRIRPVSS